MTEKIRLDLSKLSAPSLSRAVCVLVAALFGVAAPTPAAETIAGLMSDGRVITAAIEEGEAGFASDPKTVAELDADGGEFIDITAGDGVIYALREDGTVFAVDSSGDVETVSAVGWVSVSRIDFANGRLFGLKGGENPIVCDVSGRERVRVSGLDIVDFGVHGNGAITLLHRPAPGTWTYTFADGYLGPPTGFVVDGFQSWRASPAPNAIDVVGTFLTVLRSAVDGNWWQFEERLDAEPGPATKRLPEMAGLAVNDDQSLVVFLETQDGGIHSAPPVPRMVPFFHGKLASGTGVGVVVLENF